jgi:hypothetical protein
MITIGADPEIFVAKDGSFVSAFNLIPGNKENPYKVPKGAVQVDGVALEFNINPSTNFMEFKYNIDTVLGVLKSMTRGYDFLKRAVVDIDPKAIPPEARRLGCEPDFNVYQEAMNDPPDESLNFRAAGGHLHIGGFFKENQTDRDKYLSCVRLIKLLDKYIGVYSILWDLEDRRRQTYGKAGNCRIKDYGVEYRSLSNQWVFKPELTKFVHDQATYAAYCLEEGEDVKDTFFKDIIDSSNREHDFFKGNPTADYIKSLGV